LAPRIPKEEIPLDPWTGDPSWAPPVRSTYIVYQDDEAGLVIENAKLDLKYPW
jgi:hypothetical protein